MKNTYRATNIDKTMFEEHNPGQPLWLIIVCKAITFLYDAVCRAVPPKK